MKRKTHLRLAIALDVPDEFCLCRITPSHLDRMMAAWKRYGFQRVYWIHHNERGGLLSSFLPDHPNVRANLPLLGKLLPMGRAAAQRHGLEFYVTYKPYEYGGVVASAQSFAFNEATQIIEMAPVFLGGLLSKLLEVFPQEGEFEVFE
ncbi:MAG: hypothetical protein HY360_11435, partial [Verrucomicrobia bacterium]|nr:hypothetical protein [Verrucomicrobiota bacterium]